MCPHCRTNAPLVYRGVRAHCSACGGRRSVLSNASVTYAGQPAKVGGALIQAFGWIALAIGVAFSALVALIASIWASATASLITFAVLAMFPLAFFLLVRFGGKKLSESGDQSQQQRREQALFALAHTHGGMLQAMQAASALDLPVDEADRFLTQLAKNREEVDVEIGDQGEVFYTFSRVGFPSGHVAAAAWGHAPGHRVRVDPRFQEPQEVRSAPAPRAPEPVKDVHERTVLDAEFEEIENRRARR